MTQTKIGVLPHCCSMPFKTQGQQTIETRNPNLITTRLCLLHPQSLTENIENK